MAIYILFLYFRFLVFFIYFGLKIERVSWIKEEKESHFHVAAEGGLWEHWIVT